MNFNPRQEIGKLEGVIQILKEYCSSKNEKDWKVLFLPDERLLILWGGFFDEVPLAKDFNKNLRKSLKLFNTLSMLWEEFAYTIKQGDYKMPCFESECFNKLPELLIELEILRKYLVENIKPLIKALEEKLEEKNKEFGYGEEN